MIKERKVKSTWHEHVYYTDDGTEELGKVFLTEYDDDTYDLVFDADPIYYGGKILHTEMLNDIIVLGYNEYIKGKRPKND